MSIKEKLTRKELLKKDDAFLSAANVGAKWVRGNRIQVIAGVIIVLAVIFGTWGGVEYVRMRDRAASMLFNRGLTILDAAVVPDGEVAPQSDKPTYASEKDKWLAAREQFDKVIRDKGGSGVAALAALYVADLDAKLGEKEKAEKAFLALADKLSADDNLRFVAVERAVYLQEGRGELDLALKTLNRYFNSSKAFYSDFAAYHQGRLYEKKGETPKAREFYERVEKNFPSSAALADVRERLKLLGPETPPANPNAAPDVKPDAPNPEPNQAISPAPDAKNSPKDAP